jgi:hypothetical protein
MMCSSLARSRKKEKQPSHQATRIPPLVPEAGQKIKPLKLAPRIESTSLAEMEFNLFSCRHTNEGLRSKTKDLIESLLARSLSPLTFQIRDTRIHKQRCYNKVPEIGTLYLAGVRYIPAKEGRQSNNMIFGQSRIKQLCIVTGIPERYVLMVITKA